MPMHFLITGAAGFVGYHLATRLLDGGHSVTGFDGMTDYYELALKQARLARLSASANFRFVKGMLEDPYALERAVEPDTPDVIVHLAAQAGVRYSIDAPRAYIEGNLVGSLAVLELARKIQPRHLLLASTSSVYGANEALPFSERHSADRPLNVYAATKKGMEAMAHSYSHLFHIPTTTLRLFTVYGPWGRPDMALFKFVRAMLRDEPIDVYGPVSRDFTYIDDLIEGIVRLIEIAPAETNRVGDIDTLSRVAPSRVVNIAAGRPTALLDFIDTIEETLGRTARLNMMETQPGDVPQTFADPALLLALTGYVPTTGVRDGVRAFIDWHQGNYGH